MNNKLKLNIKGKKKQFNLAVYSSMCGMFLLIVGLAMLIKYQDFSVTITFPPEVIGFIVAFMGLSALWVIYKEIKKAPIK